MQHRHRETLVNREYQYGFVTDYRGRHAAGRSCPKQPCASYLGEERGTRNSCAGLAAQSVPTLANDAGAPSGERHSTSRSTSSSHQLSYYSAPRNAKKLASLNEVDPELLRTYERLGISLTEQKRLSGVAVDAIFDSVSVGTTMKDELAKLGIIFCSFGEAVREHPDLVRTYLGSVVPYSDNFFAALNGAVFSDGSFCYVPPGVQCPMELSTYFRINSAGTGQFERTLIIADKGASVSYLEGCTAPRRDTNQLHAAVVELIALEDASLDQVFDRAELVRGRLGGTRRHLQLRDEARQSSGCTLEDFVDSGRDRFSDHLEVSERLSRRATTPRAEFYSVAVVNNRQQADTGTKMIHMGRNTKST